MESGFLRLQEALSLRMIYLLPVLSYLWSICLRFVVWWAVRSGDKDGQYG